MNLERVVAEVDGLSSPVTSCGTLPIGASEQGQGQVSVGGRMGAFNRCPHPRRPTAAIHAAQMGPPGLPGRGTQFVSCAG
jgi:hypothetical protein